MSGSSILATDLLTTEIELSLSARELKYSDLLTSSCSMCVTYIQPSGSTSWEELHRTEAIPDSSDPDFVSKILLPYKLNEEELLKFELYDIDGDGYDLKDLDLLGFAVCTFGQIVLYEQVKLELRIESRDNKIEHTDSFIIISAEKLVVNNDEVVFEFGGVNLDKKDFFGKSDPFLEIYKENENGEYVIVYRTEVIKNTLNPRWKQFCIPVRILCNSNFNRNLKFMCWDWNSSGVNSRIGEFNTTLNELSKSDAKFSLIHPTKKKKSNYKASGEILVEYFQINKVYSLPEYIRNGIQLHYTLAIDFTDTNREPKHSNSLHYNSDNTDINYNELAIASIASIIQEYNPDEHLSVLGFGADFPPHENISHQFPIKIRSSNSSISNGVNDILEAYRDCVSQVQPDEIADLCPVIKDVINLAEAHKNSDGDNFNVLVILTNGCVFDLPETVKAVVEASALPISITIIGIGDPKDFQTIEALCDTSGHQVHRNILQFVPFNNYVWKGDIGATKLRFARKIVNKITRHLQSYRYAKMNVIEPKVNRIDGAPAIGEF